MKKALLFIHALLLCVLCFAQAPQGFNYQGVARNAAGEPVASKTIKVRLSILDKTATGTAVYAETHSPATNANGLFSTTVGSGTVVTGVFTNIDWANGSKFLKSEIDISGGNNFVTVATTQMMSVPYALYAQTAGKSSVKTMEATDLIFTADRFTNGQLMVAYELNSSWQNNIITVMTKSFINGNLVSSSSALSELRFRDGSNKLGILFVLYPKAGDAISLVSIFQTEDGIIYKKELNYTIPTTKYYLDLDGDGYGLMEISTSDKQKYFNITTATNSSSTYSFDEQLTNINQIVSIGNDCCDEPSGCTSGNVRSENIHPNAQEIYGNQIDENCDGVVGGCQTNADCPTGNCVAGQCQDFEICNNGIDDDGDGLTDECEICNNGLDDDFDGLVDENCTVTCGNGLIEGTEGCDDGNNVTADGCSNVCQVEGGWICSGTPSVCTPRP